MFDLEDNVATFEASAQQRKLLFANWVVELCRIKYLAVVGDDTE